MPRSNGVHLVLQPLCANLLEVQNMRLRLNHDCLHVSARSHEPTVASTSMPAAAAGRLPPQDATFGSLDFALAAQVICENHNGKCRHHDDLSGRVCITCADTDATTISRAVQHRAMAPV